MRIDGLDNIAIPNAITISPAVESDGKKASRRSSVAHYLVGQGFNEILTNSITNSAYYTGDELQTAVKMINNLSAELNILRPSLLETGLESVAYNLNRKVASLRFFEFGKTYHTSGVGKYEEINHLCLYLTGGLQEDSWRDKGKTVDIYYVKGLCERLLQLVGVDLPAWEIGRQAKLEQGLAIFGPGNTGDKLLIQGGRAKGQLVEAGAVKGEVLKRFDCKQELFFVDIYWDRLMELAAERTIEFRELPRQLPVYRDLAMVVDKRLSFEAVEKAVHKAKVDKLQEVKLFDIFESEKLGMDKRSLALSFTFLDEEKTLTDKEIEGLVNKLIQTLEKEVSAEIRK
jgi:phenylalanyl-tRNA synthetase beta chain